MYIYTRLRDTREDHEYTQAEIAKILKVGTTQYRRWEVGEYEVPTHIIIKLSTIYNLSADYLLGLPKGLPYPNTKIVIK